MLDNLADQIELAVRRRAVKLPNSFGISVLDADQPFGCRHSRTINRVISHVPTPASIRPLLSAKGTGWSTDALPDSLFEGGKGRRAAARDIRSPRRGALQVPSLPSRPPC
jgi:hypothetical protein